MNFYHIHSNWHKHKKSWQALQCYIQSDKYMITFIFFQFDFFQVFFLNYFTDHLCLKPFLFIMFRVLIIEMVLINMFKLKHFDFISIQIEYVKECCNCLLIQIDHVKTHIDQCYVVTMELCFIYCNFLLYK
jgi:hypothetical protein